MNKSPLQIAYGAFLAAGIATVIQLTGAAVFDAALCVCVACFALAAPFLGILVYAPWPVASAPETWEGLKPRQKTWFLLNFIAPKIALGGFVALFWHFHWSFGIVFAAGGYGAYRILWWWASNDAAYFDTKGD